MDTKGARYRILHSKARLLLAQYENVITEKEEAPQKVYNALHALADIFGNIWMSEKQADLLAKRYERANRITQEYEAIKRELNLESKKFREIE